MKPRTLTCLYWDLTAYSLTLMLLDSVLPVEDGKATMRLLGYPAYLLLLVGTARILGAV